MGFWSDLLGPAKPCDLCQLGQAQWPSANTAQATWSVRGQGLQATLVVCPICFHRLEQAGLQQTNPALAMAKLIAQGSVDRPPTHAYLHHPAWRRTWMHTLDTLGVRPHDEFAALCAIHDVETKFLSQLTGETELTVEARRATLRQASELVTEHIIEHVLHNQQTTELRNLAINHVPSNPYLKNGLLPFALFLSFVAARSRWGETVAEEFLTEVFRSIGASSEGTRFAAIEDAVAFCKSYEETGPTEELVSECIWAAVFDSKPVDEATLSALDLWIAKQLQTLDELIEPFALSGRTPRAQQPS